MTESNNGKPIPLADEVEKLKARVNRIEASLPRKQVASDAILDNPEWGDPVLRFQPRGIAEQIKGSHFSELTPDQLDAVALVYDDFAQRNRESGKMLNNGKMAYTYDERDAAKARGWAERKRKYGATPNPENEPDF